MDNDNKFEICSVDAVDNYNIDSNSRFSSKYVDVNEEIKDNSKNDQIYECINPKLIKLKEFCKQYITSDEEYLYKTCNNYIIIMKKTSDTITNEERKNIINYNFAKFRANVLYVVAIVEIDNLTTIDEITNCANYNKGNILKIIYKINNLVFPDKFDQNINIICTSGIHYFKTLDAAFYYNYNPQENTGKCYYFYPNGEFYSIANYKHGKLSGKYISWHTNGTKLMEGYYVDTMRIGVWTFWHDIDGKKSAEGSYNDYALKYGKWTEWDNRGNISEEGEYVDDKKNGIWTTYVCFLEKNPISMNMDSFNVIEKVSYVDGILNGKTISHYENGNKEEEGEFFQGDRTGLWTRWYYTGNKKSECRYIYGNRSMYSEWSNDGKEITRGLF